MSAQRQKLIDFAAEGLCLALSANRTAESGLNGPRSMVWNTGHNVRYSVRHVNAKRNH
jgi:hypothetical protein